MLQVYGDAETMRYVGDGQPISPNECAHWIQVTLANYQTRGYGMMIVHSTGSGELIGFAGLVHPGSQTEPELKYALSRTCWGQGYATELNQGMLRFGFDMLSMNRIISTVHSENQSSIRVLEKLGMCIENERCEGDGSITLVYSITAKNYRNSTDQ